MRTVLGTVRSRHVSKQDDRWIWAVRFPGGKQMESAGSYRLKEDAIQAMTRFIESITIKKEINQ